MFGDFVWDDFNKGHKELHSAPHSAVAGPVDIL
jgi:hypothetical protein